MAQTVSLADVFLEKYKSLELMLRVAYGDDMTVLSYENTLVGDSSDKMRICRIMRNFLQHNPNAAGFVEPTQLMVLFLDQEISMVAAAAEKAKDRLYRLTPLKDTSTLRDACKAFTKGKGAIVWMPVVDGNGVLIGILREQRLIQALSVASDPDEVCLNKAIRKAEWNKSVTLPVIQVTDDLAQYAKKQQDVVVLRNGKYSGVIMW